MNKLIPLQIYWDCHTVRCADKIRTPIPDLRIMEEVAALKSLSECFFVNIDIAELSCCTGWVLSRSFPWRLQETDIWIQSGVSPTAFFRAKLCVGGQQLSLQLQLYLFLRPSLLPVMSITFNDLHQSRYIPLLRCQAWDEDACRQRQCLRENHKQTWLQGKTRIPKQARRDGESQSDMQISRKKHSHKYLPEQQSNILNFRHLPGSFYLITLELTETEIAAVTTERVGIIEIQANVVARQVEKCKQLVRRRRRVLSCTRRWVR